MAIGNFIRTARLAIVSSLFCGASAFLEADEPSKSSNPVARTIRSETPYFRGGAKELKQLGTFKAETKVQVLKEAGRWVRVRALDGTEGWVASAALTKSVGDNRPISATNDSNEISSTAVDASNAFALKLYLQAASQQQGNVLLSPTSVSSTLSILKMGAMGPTKKQINDVLHLSENVSGRSSQTADTDQFPFNRDLNRTGAGFEVRSVNHLWSKKGLSVLPAFQEAARKQFEAAFTEIDFSSPTTAQTAINNWGSENTNKLIPQLLSTPLNPDTQLVVTNATYFKGTWECRFQKDFTEPMSFTVSANETIDVPMMKLKSSDEKRPLEIPYFKTSDFKAISLPYKGKTLSAVFILPERVDGLSQLEEQLSAKNLARWTSAMKLQDVTVLLPKFTLSSDLRMGEILSKMGMPMAFGPEADFSGIANEPLKLIELVHQARIQVDETGTEAAAGSGGLVAVGIKELFRADHPFLFLIRDNQSGVILFIGRVVKPELRSVSSGKSR